MFLFFVCLLISLLACCDLLVRFTCQVRELNVEASKLTTTHPNAAQDIEWKRHELEEAWANLREQVIRMFDQSCAANSVQTSSVTVPLCSFHSKSAEV